MRSIWLGGLIAPLAAPLAFFCVVLIMSILGERVSEGAHLWLPALGLVTVFTLPVSYLATWILGMPFIFWLRSSSRLTRWNICLGATGIGVIAVLILQSMAKNGPPHLEQVAFGALVSAGLALCVALTFCWIVKVPSSSG